MDPHSLLVSGVGREKGGTSLQVVGHPKSSQGLELDTGNSGYFCQLDPS